MILCDIYPPRVVFLLKEGMCLLIEISFASFGWLDLFVVAVEEAGEISGLIYAIGEEKCSLGFCYSCCY